MLDSSVVVLTRKCYPCGCSYCNVLKKDFNNFWIGLFKDKKYFDYIIQQYVKLLKKNNINSVRFFGGEVFLEKDILIYFIQKLRFYDYTGDIIVNTNLHLFDKKDLFWIKENNVKIITSLNGFSDLHCKTRGVSENDYKQLLETINFLVKENVDLQINVVLFPFEDDFVEKIKFILTFKVSKINLLPLMYSKLITNKNIDSFLQKLEKLLIWIKENKLQNKFLNFDLLDKDFDNFALTPNELLLDSNGNIYTSMIVLEHFTQKYKDLLQIASVEDLLEIDFDSYKINMQIISKILVKEYSDIFLPTNILSNQFTKLLLKYNK